MHTKFSHFYQTDFFSNKDKLFLIINIDNDFETSNKIKSNIILKDE